MGFLREEMVETSKAMEMAKIPTAPAAMDQADARNNPSTRGIVVVHAVGSQRCDLQKRAAVIKQVVDPFAR